MLLNSYLKITYGRERYHLCSDVLCEIADITVGDPWGRNEHGRLTYRGSDGYSAAIIRSESVQQLLHEMEQNQNIQLQEEKNSGTFLKVQFRQVRAAKAKVSRVAVTAKKRGRPYTRSVAAEIDESQSLSLSEQLSRFLERLAHLEPFRSVVLRLMFSPVGDLLTRLNSICKQYSSMAK